MTHRSAFSTLPSGRLLCGQRGCPSRTPYGISIIARGGLHVNPVGDENLRDLFDRTTARGHTHQNRKKDMELLHIRGTLSIVLIYWFCSVLPCRVFCDKLEKNLQGSDRMSLREKLLRVAPEDPRRGPCRLPPRTRRGWPDSPGSACRWPGTGRSFGGTPPSAHANVAAVSDRPVRGNSTARGH